MTPHQRAALAFRLAALAAAGTAVWTGLRHEWILTAALAYGVFLLAFLGGRCQKVHLVDQARHERARRAAHTDAATLAAPLPCCSFWRHSDGKVHGPDCTRHPETRPVRDGLPLDDTETTVADQVTARTQKEH